VGENAGIFPQGHNMQKSSNLTKWLGIGIILIQLFDIIIHVATDQAEPIRIASNIIVIGWLVGVLAGWLQGQWRPISFGVIGTYLLLNLIFLAQNGLTNPEQGGALRTMLFLLVGATVGLGAWLVGQMRR
jgi:hypothetical protein